MSAPTPRVQSVPAAHAYVRHCLTPASAPAGLRLLPDPPVPGASANQWWPSPVLDPTWPSANRFAVDVVHLHFGFEHRTADELNAWCDALEAADLPLVLTVHDLANPHLHDQRPHEASLGVLVPRAGAVITLTEGAASEIRQRWGVTAQVLPHPHVIPAGRLGHRPPRRSGPTRIGVPLGALRASVDPRMAARLLDALPADAELHLDLRPGRRAQLLSAADLGERVGNPRLQIEERAAGSEHDFADRVADFDVLVLPYRFGTHSGWVEAAHDLGVPVVAPRIGYWHQQHPLHGFGLDDDAALAEAVHAASGQTLDPAPATQRVGQRQALADEHARLYARLTAQRASA